MKNIFSLLLLWSPLLLSAQQMRGTDASPMDVAYFPDDFAHDIRFAPEALEFVPEIQQRIQTASQSSEIKGRWDS